MLSAQATQVGPFIYGIVKLRGLGFENQHDRYLSALVTNNDVFVARFMLCMFVMSI
jgi:hypothetical protein